MREIFITKPSFPPFEEYVNEIKYIWDSGILTNCGPKHNELKIKLQEYTGCDNIELFTSGHTALEFALEIIGEKAENKNEIITTPFTFASTVNAIERKGFKPVFCDITDNYTIDTDKIEGLINDSTAAILPVHVYGNVCDVEKIKKIGVKYNIPVIYDGAHSFGEEITGKNIANFGDITMFSFHATKAFGCGEGGALSFNGPEAEKHASLACKLRNFGLSEGNCQYAGGNGKMQEFSASFGLCNLRHLDEYTEARKNIYNIYKKKLSCLEFIKTALSDANGLTKRNYSYAPFIFTNENELLMAMERLEKNGIHSRRYFYPAVCDMEYYVNKYGIADVPRARDISKRVLCLPLSSDITEAEAEFICKIISDKITTERARVMVK